MLYVHISKKDKIYIKQYCKLYKAFYIEIGEGFCNNSNLPIPTTFVPILQKLLPFLNSIYLYTAKDF